MADRSVRVLSERSLLLGTDGAAQARGMARALAREGSWQEVVPGLDSVAVLFDPRRLSLDEARDRLLAAAKVDLASEAESGVCVTIPVRYGGEDGPDLGHVAELHDMTEKQVIERHAEGHYTVEIMGFLPGFAYLGGLDPELATPRLEKPRLRVPAGSVGIGGSYSGIYSLDGSGGWPLIGRTEMVLFDPSRDEPFTLAPGTMVRFEPV